MGKKCFNYVLISMGLWGESCIPLINVSDIGLIVKNWLSLFLTKYFSVTVNSSNIEILH